MRLFSAIANAFSDFTGGNRRQRAQLFHQAEAELTESVAFREGVEQLIGAARLTGDDQKAAIQRIDQTLRGNTHYEKVRDELLTITTRFNPSNKPISSTAQSTEDL